MSIKRGNLLRIILGCVLFLSMALFGITAGYKPASADGTFTITSVSQTAKESEMYAFKLNASGYSTSDGYNHLSKEVDDTINVYDKIELNGKSITEWNTEYSETAAGWTFGWFPASSAGFYYKMPIVMRGYKGVMRMYIHENMYSIIVAEYGNMIVQLKAGLSAEGYTLAEDTGRYKVIDNSGIPASGNAEVMPDTVEISPDNVSVSEWINESGKNELNVCYLNLGTGVMPKLNYDIIDKPAYQYLADYIAINGKTVAEINSTTDTSGYTFTIYPSTLGGDYAVPIMLLVDENYNIQVKIHNAYYETLTEDVTVSALEGFSVVNGNKEYVLNETVNHTRKGGTWVKNWQTVEIAAEDVEFSGWTSINGIKAFYINFAEGVLPAGIGYGVISDAAYKYIADYITINGKTISWINTNTSVDGWEFNMFPSRDEDNMPQYKVAVMVFVDNTNNNIEIRIHDNYYATLGGTLNVSVSEGLTIVNGTNEYVLAETASSICKYGTWSADWKTVEIQAADVSFSGWTSINGIRAFKINFAEGVLPAGIGYGVISDAAYKYIADYITINGKTITWINANTSVDGWEFNMFPSRDEDNMPQYKVPVIVLVNSSENNIEIRIHDNYYATLGGTLNVSVLEGLTIVNGTNEYVLAETASSICKYGTWSVDWQNIEIQAADISVSGWTSINGIKAFKINFAEGVLPAGISYGVISDAAYKYIADYITINGKTITWINANTSVDGWEFNMFPSRDEDNMPQYKVPVIVLVNSSENNIDIRIHDNYYAILPSVSVSVSEGLTIVNGTSEYVLNGTASYRRKSNQWLDLNHEYSITYYVNGEVYATDKYKLDETVTMHAAPNVDLGYEFSGWDKTITKMSGDEEISGTISVTTYNITYKLGGGKNSPQNPLKYTIEDETIVLKDAKKDGCSFLGWYDASGNKVEQIEAGSYGDIVLNAKFTEEAGGGCSSNVSGDVFGYVALLMCAAMVLTLKRVGKKADK